MECKLRSIRSKYDDSNLEITVVRWEWRSTDELDVSWGGINSYVNAQKFTIHKLIARKLALSRRRRLSFRPLPVGSWHYAQPQPLVTQKNAIALRASCGSSKVSPAAPGKGWLHTVGDR